MVNLIIAIIISDIQELKLEVKVQDTINKAFQAITYNKLFTLAPLNYKKDIYIHMTGGDCRGIKVSLNTQNDLLSIVRSKKGYQTYPC